MKRLDFEIVAQAMRQAKTYSHYSEDEVAMANQWRADCEALADAFAQQSAAFERVRFLVNCGCYS